MIRRLAVRAPRLNAGVAVLLGLIAFGAAAAGAQQSLSTVQGHGIDESGAVVPGATVVLRDGERGLVRTEVTDGMRPRLVAGRRPAADADRLPIPLVAGTGRVGRPEAALRQAHPSACGRIRPTL